VCIASPACETVALDDVGRELPFSFKYTRDQVVTSDPPTRVDLAPSTGVTLAIPTWLKDRLGYCGPGDPGSTVFVSPLSPTLAASIDYGGQRARAQATRDATSSCRWHAITLAKKADPGLLTSWITSGRKPLGAR